MTTGLAVRLGANKTSRLGFRGVEDLWGGGLKATSSWKAASNLDTGDGVGGGPNR